MLKPVICVLLGDASGVGAEIVVKAFSGTAGLLEQAKVVMLGDERVLVCAEKIIGKSLDYERICPENIRKTGRTCFWWIQGILIQRMRPLEK